MPYRISGAGAIDDRVRLMTWPLVLSLYWYIEVTRGSHEVVTSSPVRCVAKLRWLSLVNRRFHQTRVGLLAAKGADILPE
jgi:hypothetical protein